MWKVKSRENDVIFLETEYTPTPQLNEEKCLFHLFSCDIRAICEELIFFVSQNAFSKCVLRLIKLSKNVWKISDEKQKISTFSTPKKYFSHDASRVNAIW